MESVQTKKTCTKCRVEKPTTEFRKHTRNRDGLQCWCKACFHDYYVANAARVAEKGRKYRAENAELVRAKKNAAYRANPDPVKDRAQKWDAANPERTKERMAKWTAKNRERARANAARWRSENRERTRELSRVNRGRRRARQANLPAFDLLEKDLRRLLSSPCAVAGCANTDIQIDHVIPIARGGSHGVGNFQPLCGTHNQSKATRLWIEFRVYLQRRAALAA